MLWMGICEMSCVAMISGMVGGCLMAYAQRQSNKFNMNAMETYWNADISFLKSHIEALERKLSTISVVKPVNKEQKHNNNNGYKHKRRINQGA